LTTQGLWHYPATITNATIATAFAEFAPATGFPTTSTAGVINNIDGRQQVVYSRGGSRSQLTFRRWYFSLDLQQIGVLHQHTFNTLGLIGQLEDYV
jgi:hypothetical protein